MAALSRIVIIMPLSNDRRSVHDAFMAPHADRSVMSYDLESERRRTLTPGRSRSGRRRSYNRLEARSTRLPSSGPLDLDQFGQRPAPIWLRLQARCLAASLDRQLTRGLHSEAERLLTVRAAQLVSPRNRGALARGWLNLLNRAHRLPAARDPHVPLCRDRIIAVEGEVRAMISALRSPLAVPARGVVLANHLLSDGTGPLYSWRCSEDLGAVVREVTAQLDLTYVLTDLG